jgi:hypothetical protein
MNKLIVFVVAWEKTKERMNKSIDLSDLSLRNWRIYESMKQNKERINWVCEWSPTHSSLLAKKSNPFFAAGALRPAKKWSCLGVWVKEWGCCWVEFVGG